MSLGKPVGVNTRVLLSATPAAEVAAPAQSAFVTRSWVKRYVSVAPDPI